jgi:hypothetical protein
MSQSEFVVMSDGHVEGQLVFAALELAPAVTLDRDGDGAVTSDEVTAAHAELARLALDGVEVSADGATCPTKLRSVELIESDGLAFVLASACPRSARRIAVTLFLLSELRPGHRHAARVTAGERTAQKVLTASSREVALDLPRSANATDAHGGWRRTVLVVATAVWFGFMVVLIVWRYRRARRGALRAKPR